MAWACGTPQLFLAKCFLFFMLHAFARLGEVRAVGPRHRRVRNADRHIVAGGGQRVEQVDSGACKAPSFSWPSALCFINCMSLLILEKFALEDHVANLCVILNAMHGGRVQVNVAVVLEPVWRPL